jgi:hypothetical protein
MVSIDSGCIGEVVVTRGTPVLRMKGIVSQLAKKFPAIYRPQSSLMCSQEPATPPYVEEVE